IFCFEIAAANEPRRVVNALRAAHRVKEQHEARCPEPAWVSRCCRRLHWFLRLFLQQSHKRPKLRAGLDEHRNSLRSARQTIQPSRASVEASLGVKAGNQFRREGDLCGGTSMRNPTIVIAAVSALCACGGSGGGANGRAFDQMIAGIWNGTSTLEVQGIERIVYSSSLKIEVSGSTGNISNVCPDGTGAFPLEGSGSSAQWANR